MIVSIGHLGNSEAAQLLVDNGADVNMTVGWGTTPLLWAAIKGNVHLNIFFKLEYGKT